MRIGVPREPADQPRAAASPQTVERMIRLGYEVLVERGAGERAQFPDDAYEAAGAQPAGGARVWGCDVVLSASAPGEEHLALMSRGAVLICRLDPARRPDLLEQLRERGITCLALDVVPRISRAQSLDVLSSQANLAGYRAVIEAAAHLGRLFSGQVTAAGKFSPATVYVIGAGVAGLSAIGTAYSLGAQVRGSDVRPEVADQASAANALYAQQAAESDVVITTASIPGRRAPMLLDRSAIEAMRPGSVIIDMAAATGGNTELTVPGEVVTTEGGVTIVGHTDLAGMLPAQATQLYGRNIVNLLGLITPAKDGELALDLDDEVVRAITVTHDGELLWPPPPIQVSATPAPGRPEQAAAEDAAAQEAARVAQARSRSRQWLGLAAASLVAAALVLVTPAAATSHYIVLMLSVILGFHVISNVTPALHTPLMSVTNAISGIILVGAISQVGHPHPLISAISLAAVVLATINIVGGFAVTHRMLAMFTKD